MTLAPPNAQTLRRATGASLVLLLHLVVIAFLLNATVHAIKPVSPSRDGTLWFVFPPRIRPESVRIIPAPAASSPVTRFTIPRTAITTTFAKPNVAAHGDLHALLFDCAPENLASLSPEQRTQCMSAAGSVSLPDDSDITAERPTRSASAAYWARGRARKNAPLLLPCASPDSVFATFSLAGLMCLAKAVKQGKFDLDEQPGYADPAGDTSPPSK